MDEQRKTFEAWFFDGVAVERRTRDNEYDIAYAAWQAATLAERGRAAKVCDPYTHGQWFAAAIRQG